MDKIDESMTKLTQAIERVYGSVWRLIWRNFISGLTFAFGSTVGYAIFVSIAILIAQKLGMFDLIKEFWQNLLKQLPTQQF